MFQDSDVMHDYDLGKPAPRSTASTVSDKALCVLCDDQGGRMTTVGTCKFRMCPSCKDRVDHFLRPYHTIERDPDLPNKASAAERVRFNTHLCQECATAPALADGTCLVCLYLPNDDLVEALRDAREANMLQLLGLHDDAPMDGEERACGGCAFNVTPTCIDTETGRCADCDFYRV